MKQGWEYKKLGEVASFFRGLTYSGKDEVSFSNNIVLRSNNIDLNTNTINFDELKFISDSIIIPKDKKLKKNSIFMCMSNGSKLHLGKVAFIDKEYPYAFGGFMGLIVPKEDELMPKMAYYYFCSQKFKTYLSSIGNGANINNIKFVDIAKDTIPIPPKSTQLSIVSELDKINELIRLKKEQLKDYDNLAQSIFYEMFGDPVENEKGWEVKKWKEVFNTILGKMLDKSKQINHLKQYKYLANMNVQWGYFDLKELRSMTFTDEELAKYELRNNDLLICEGGDAGRCAIWKETDETILFQKAIHRARLIDTDNADVVYIRYWMQFYKVNKGLKDYISKSTIEHLTGDKLKRLPIPLPPLPLQHLFAQRIEQIERQKSAVQKSITDLETLLASRMQYWFE